MIPSVCGGGPSPSLMRIQEMYPLAQRIPSIPGQPIVVLQGLLDVNTVTALVLEERCLGKWENTGPTKIANAVVTVMEDCYSNPEGAKIKNKSRKNPEFVTDSKLREYLWKHTMWLEDVLDADVTGLSLLVDGDLQILHYDFCQGSLSDCQRRHNIGYVAT